MHLFFLCNKSFLPQVFLLYLMKININAKN